MEQKTLIIIIIVVVVVFLLLFVFSSVALTKQQEEETTGTVPLVPIINFDREGYFVTVPANTNISVISTTDIPFGGLTSSNIPYNGLIPKNTNFMFSSSSPIQITMSSRLTPTVLNGKVTFEVPILNPDSFIFVWLKSQGFINGSNGVSFQATQNLSLGWFENQGFKQILEDSSGTMTITY